jgi:hypothetical protein
VKVDFRYTIGLMTNHIRDEEECRLIDIAETCRSDESAASNALTHPLQSLPYAEYQRLVDVLKGYTAQGPPKSDSTEGASTQYAP